MSKLRILLLLVFLLLCVKPFGVVVSQTSSFFQRGYNFPLYKHLYSVSQYSVKNSKDIIPDQVLESYAGGAFLNGINPILIIHDQPPLGRYITALSIMLFDNPRTLTFFCLLFTLIGIFLITNLILKDWVLSLIPMGIFMNDPIFLGKLTLEPLLEPIQLPFIIFSIYFFMLALIKKNNIWFVHMALMMGAVISTRFFALGAVLALSLFAVLLLQRKSIKILFQFAFSLLLSIAVLLASYFQTIRDGSSLIHIFGIQKYILVYHRQQLTMPFSFFDLLLFNRWHTWWGNYAIIQDSQWFFLWPLSVVVIVFLFFKLKEKLSILELTILLWIIAESLFLSLGEVSTRYFLPLVPFLYVLVAAMMKKVFIKEKKK